MFKIVGDYLNKMESFSAPVKAAFWFTLCSIINKCIQLVTIPIFTRLLSTTQYGEYSVFISWQNILLIIVTLNIYSNVFNNGMIKYASDQDSFLSSMQGLTTTITLIFIITLFLFKNFFVKLIGLPMSLILVLLIEIMLTPGYELWAAKQRFDFKYKKVILSTMVLVILNPIVGLIFVNISNEKGYARILSVLLVQITIYGFSYCHNFIRSKLFFNKVYWKYALVLAIPLIPHYLSQTLLNQMDKIMIADICGSDKAGIYSVAYSGAMILQIIGKSIQSSFTPWIYKKLKLTQEYDISGVVNGLLLLVGGMNFFLICLAPEVIALLAGKNYMEAIYVIPPISCSAYLIFLYSLFCVIEFYYEQTKAMMIVSAMGAGINYLANFILIPLYGYYAAGYTTLVCYILFVIAHFYVMRQALIKNGGRKNLFDLRFILIFTIAFLIVGVTISFLYSNFIVRYTVLLLVLVVAILKRKWMLSQIKAGS